MMKFFFLKLLYSFLFILIFISFIYAVNSCIFHLVHSKYYKDTDTLIAGDSRLMFLNEKIISKSLNLSEGSETYKVMFHKIKYIHELDTLLNVVIPYSYCNVAYFNDYNMNDSYFSIYRLYPIVSLSTLFRTTNNVKEFFNVIFKYKLTFNSTYFFRLLGFIEKEAKSPLELNHHYNEFDFLEEKHDYKRYGKDQIQKREKQVNKYINLHYKKMPGLSKLSDVYLEKIALFCKENHIKLFLVNMPFDPNYRNRTPDSIKQKYIELLDIIRSRYDLKYLNYDNYFDEKLFLMKDCGHTSWYGSGIISQELEKKINRK